jgi:hypothetical protein
MAGSETEPISVEISPYHSFDLRGCGQPAEQIVEDQRVPTVLTFRSFAIPTAREFLDKNSPCHAPLSSDPALLSILAARFESQLVLAADFSANA